MKARDVVGRKIVAVRHIRLQASGGDVVPSVDEIELDNGTILRPHVFELESGDNYGVDMLAVKPKLRKKTRSLSVAQQRTLDRIRSAGSVRFNGRKERTLRVLESRGLIALKYDLVPNANHVMNQVFIATAVGQVK